MFHPLIRFIDWYRTSPDWRETRKAIPGQLGLEMLAVMRKLNSEGAAEEGGNNRGKWIERFGGKQGSAWCGWNVFYCCVQACLRLGRSEIPLPRTGGAGKLFKAALKVGFAVAEVDVKPGDLILFDRGVLGRKSDRWKKHIGIVDQVVRDTDGATMDLWYRAGNEGPFPAQAGERHRLTPAKRKRLEGFARLP